MSTQENTAESAAEAAGTVAAYRSYPVAPGYRLNVRSGPSTSAAVVRTLQAGSSVPIRCQRHGERVSGPYGSSDIWDCIGSGEYVSDAYVQTGSDGFVAQRCTS
ncbi:SH3 domain-containing protein [Streptomyces ochraceiscleroticus]|uniref:SH3 domain-containing protein n=1 Tax=Streptomyces ochraceiscleroticus TaxID=47761 RepID=A0ABW1MLH7_9ACTN|nr:SH3 domain-containing protein [Streptomyces ochraceiscleroticus]